MPDRSAPIVRGYPHLLHGGDYNPEQWRQSPQVWDQDFQLLQQAACNTVTVGVFAWAALEPAEGRYDFNWMDAIFERCRSAGLRVILATPGGGMPAWLAKAYPEVLRVDSRGRRRRWGGRHNHCFTAPVYREKARIINGKLAERYGQHPMLSLWHVNNEYSGECHCDLCSAAFRQFLRRRYNDSLDALNHAWWSAFWSHTITNWDQIEPPSREIGEFQVHGQTLDWKRFITHQTIDCFKEEAEPLRQISPGVPVTTNLMMGGFTDVDYYHLADACDVVSWDSYPSYHDRPGDYFGPLGPLWVSFIHNQRRAMKKKPFLLMEMSPGAQNYKPVCKLKRPGVHQAEALQAIAHGSDSVLYFQVRKSRGGVEKFHGAVIDHFATPEARVFREVAEVGRVLQGLDEVVGTHSRADVAFIYDYQNRWALNDAAGPINLKKDKDYDPVCREHYRPFWSAGVNVDVISMDQPFDGYKLLVAPMLYMVRPGVAERIEKFIDAGGTFVTTFLSGVANESDLAFTNGFPGPLRGVTGVWAEEIDALYDDEQVPIVAGENIAGLSGRYGANFLCDVIHAEGADVLATYGGEFYAGRPAVTRNAFGRGRAYYIAARTDARFNADFYNHQIQDLGLRRALDANLPDGVTAATRGDGRTRFTFVLSFRGEPCEIQIGPAQQGFTNALTGETVGRRLMLPAYGTLVLRSDVHEGDEG